MNTSKPSTGTGHYIHLFPIVMILPSMIACFAYANISQSYWDLFGLLIIIAFASMLLGGLLGFLFAIPKLNKNYNPHEDYDRSTKYMPNTNLEDVSDWLTKIIIGVTLTQLGRIPGYLQSMADYLIDNSNLMLQVDSARPLLIALIIYSFVAGFIIGYSYTRIYLPNLFSIMEENRKQKAEIALWKEEVRKKEEQLCNHPNSEDKPS
ncbi:putative membrane protein [Proteiniphilum saccharofermentans]|uniref:Putative membrane protein n=1 Tax=Proteiniphilum saccharofermentans TaxID=1642647 RepID=A0A1R3T9S6_9BACT|nr:MULTISPECIES: hypothetical protein [Proteiniphilum]MDY9919891.1 hypothetical protein [Proteiniphilum sp.]SCD20725.1 putative membrane protein [Proteiniphilum saccharofermentans]SFT06433.1 hypothetical protein SAMN05216365_1537 [Porphyromonadaceae bacterium NLAE-zl-C104]